MTVNLHVMRIVCKRGRKKFLSTLFQTSVVDAQFWGLLQWMIHS